MSTQAPVLSESERVTVEELPHTSTQPREILLVCDQPDDAVFSEIKCPQMAGRDIVRVASAGEVHDHLADGRVDAVVSNLRSLSESLSLLNELLSDHPCVKRFIRAEVGEISPEIITKHVILPRTWSGALIEDAINRTLALAKWQANSALLEVVSSIHKVPTLPSLYTEITEALKNDCSAEEIADLISKEPGITAKLIQFVNSGQAALKRRISNPVEAVMFFGTQRLRTLVLLSSMFTRYDGRSCVAFSLDHFFKNSMQVATWSSSIAMEECKNKEFADMCFTSGLLHDFGLLLLASTLPKRYKEAFSYSIERKISLDSAESEMFGVTHADLGGFILATWNLPFPIINAVGHHHAPSASHDREFTALTAVHIAAAVSGYTRSRKLIYDRTYMERIGMPDKVEFWANKLAPQR